MMSPARQGPAENSFVARSGLLVNPLGLVSIGCGAGCRRPDRCDGRCGRGGRGWHRHRSGRRSSRAICRSGSGWSGWSSGVLRGSRRDRGGRRQHDANTNQLFKWPAGAVAEGGGGGGREWRDVVVPVEIGPASPSPGGSPGLEARDRDCPTARLTSSRPTGVAWTRLSDQSDDWIHDVCVRLFTAPGERRIDDHAG